MPARSEFRIATTAITPCAGRRVKLYPFKRACIKIYAVYIQSISNPKVRMVRMKSAEVRYKDLRADFGKTAADYGRHRAGFPDEFFERLIAIRIIRGGIRALDVGTGTGTIARGLALRGCEVTGLDRSVPLMEEAAELDRGAGGVVKYVNAAAEETRV